MIIVSVEIPSRRIGKAKSFTLVSHPYSGNMQMADQRLAGAPFSDRLAPGVRESAGSCTRVRQRNRMFDPDPGLSIPIWVQSIRRPGSH